MPFDYRGVTLDGGRLRLQLDEVRDYYLRIPNDDLLKGFRQRAKLPAPGKDLGGWYSSDTFHVFGQILSGLARLYAATGDAACKEKVDAAGERVGQVHRRRTATSTIPPNRTPRTTSTTRSSAGWSTPISTAAIGKRSAICGGSPTGP